MKVLDTQKKEIAEAMMALCDAIGKLGRVRDEMEKSLADVAPGDPSEYTTLRMTRACTSLVNAVAEVPEECWNIMMADIGDILPARMKPFHILAKNTVRRRTHGSALRTLGIGA